MTGKPLHLLLALAVSVAIVTPPAAGSASPAAAAATPAGGVRVQQTQPGSLPAGSDIGLVIAKPKPGVGIASVSAAGHERLPLLRGGWVLRAPAGESGASFAAELAATGKFAYVSPDYVRTVSYSSTPDDPDFTDATQSFLFAHAKSWWERGTGSAHFDEVWPYLTPDGATVPYDARATGDQVKVAIIDTGFYMDHPDKGDIVVGQDCFATYDGSVMTTDADVTPDAPSSSNSTLTASHGTMTASEVSQDTDNGVGGAGSSWDTQVRFYKVQGTLTTTVTMDGYPYPPGTSLILDSAVYDAIILAADDGCRVISMSLGGSAPDPALQDAVDYAYGKGAVVVAATGNHDPGQNPSVEYPAACDHVIGVGAYTLTGGGGSVASTVPVVADFSNDGSGTDILAPGVDVWGPTRPDWDQSGTGVVGYGWWSGTSMATPLVASAASLLLRWAPGLTPDEVENILEHSAVDLGPHGYDTTNGWGALDVAAAYDLLKADYPNLTAPRLTGIADGGLYDRSALTLGWGAVTGAQVSYTVTGDWGAPAVVTTGTSVTLQAIPDGTHAVSVVPSSPLDWNVGATATVTFTVDTVAPTTPTVTCDGTTVSWTDPENGATHTSQIAFDTTSSPLTVPGGSYPLPVTLVSGAHTVYVRETDAAGNAGPWGSAHFTIAPRIITTLTNTTPSMTLAWDAPAMLSGTLRDTSGTALPGLPVTLRYSKDGGATWRTLEQTATTDPLGMWHAIWRPNANALVRVSFAADPLRSPSTSPLISLRQRICLTSARTPDTVQHRTGFTTFGYLKPRLTAGSYPVRIAFYQLVQRSDRTYVWVLRETVPARASGFRSYTEYAARTSVPYAGRWKAIVTYPGSSAYATTTSTARYFAAR